MQYAAAYTVFKLSLNGPCHGWERLVCGISARRSGFNPRTVYVGHAAVNEVRNGVSCKNLGASLSVEFQKLHNFNYYNYSSSSSSSSSSSACSLNDQCSDVLMVMTSSTAKIIQGRWRKINMVLAWNYAEKTTHKYSERIPSCPAPVCPSKNPHTRTGLGYNPGLRGERPTTNCQSHVW